MAGFEGIPASVKIYLGEVLDTLPEPETVP